jgi:hypothetical protein
MQGNADVGRQRSGPRPGGIVRGNVTEPEEARHGEP